MYDNSMITTVETEKKEIIKGKEIWNNWIENKDYNINDYTVVFLKEEYSLYKVAVPYFKYLKERKNINRIFLITNYLNIDKIDTFEVDDILIINDTSSMNSLIKYFKTIDGCNSIVFLTVDNKYGGGIEELISSGEVSLSDYVKIALLDLGGLLW